MLREVKPTKIFEQVMEQIKGIIQDGELECGDQLPSERDLCEQFNVSRTSIREALRSLEMLGIVECRQGEGDFIKESFEGSLLEPISVTFMLHGSKTNEILELRKTIEPETATLVAKSIDDAELREIKELMSLLSHEDDPARSAETDEKIHYRIVQTSGNNFIADVMCTVSNLIDRYIEGVVSNLFQSPENRNIVKERHEVVVRAIEAHDALEAATAMRKHLDYANDFISSSIIKEQDD